MIVAELSANHAGSLQVALESIKAMAECGVDAVKLQTYTPDSLTLNVKAPDFQLHGGLWDNRWLHDLYTEGSTPYEWHKTLFDYARSLGLIIFSTPFDKKAVDLLESLDNPIYKIASFEVMDLELIRYAASKGKPMVISTGIATDREIFEAIETCRSVGNNDITLLKCTSAYPAPIEEANLSMIPAMRQRYGVKVGLSDHSPGTVVAEIATMLSAVMIEKHFILDRALGGPDAEFSMTPDEFRLLVSRCNFLHTVEGTIINGALQADNMIRRGQTEANDLIYKGKVSHPESFSDSSHYSFSETETYIKDILPSLQTSGSGWDKEIVEKVMGTVDFDRAGQSDGRKWSRSLYIAAPVAKGEIFTEENVRCVRPGYSLHPRYFNQLMGKMASNDYAPGDRIPKTELEN